MQGMRCLLAERNARRDDHNNGYYKVPIEQQWKAWNRESRKRPVGKIGAEGTDNAKMIDTGVVKPNDPLAVKGTQIEDTEMEDAAARRPRNSNDGPTAQELLLKYQSEGAAATKAIVLCRNAGLAIGKLDGVAYKLRDRLAMKAWKQLGNIEAAIKAHLMHCKCSISVKQAEELQLEFCNLATVVTNAIVQYGEAGLQVDNLVSLAMHIRDRLTSLLEMQLNSYEAY